MLSFLGFTRAIPCGLAAGWFIVRGVYEWLLGVIEPEPFEHLGHNGTAMIVGMSSFGEGEVHFVTLGFQRFRHGYILKMPIALRIARVRIIMESVFDENADRPLFTVENP